MARSLHPRLLRCHFSSLLVTSSSGLSHSDTVSIRTVSGFTNLESHSNRDSNPDSHLTLNPSPVPASNPDQDAVLVFGIGPGTGFGIGSSTNSSPFPSRGTYTSGSTSTNPSPIPLLVRSSDGIPGSVKEGRRKGREGTEWERMDAIAQVNKNKGIRGRERGKWEVEEEGIVKHLVGNFAVSMCSNGATMIAFDYTKMLVRFVNKGVEVAFAPFEALTKVIRGRALLEKEAARMEEVAGLLALNSESSKSVGLDDIDAAKLCLVKGEAAHSDSNNSGITSSVVKSNGAGFLDNVRLVTMADLNIPPIGNRNRAPKSTELCVVKGRTVGLDEEKELANAMDDNEYLKLELHFSGRPPITFMCWSMLERDHMFDRFRTIIRTSPEQIPKLGCELELVIHRGFASRSTKSGLFSKQVLLVVMPGRVFEFDGDAPSEIGKTTLNFAMGPGATPLALTHSNVCPREIFPIFTSLPASLNGNSVVLTTFVHSKISQEYTFDSRQEAETFLKAVCICHKIWEHLECTRNMGVMIDEKSELRRSHMKSPSVSPGRVAASPFAFLPKRRQSPGSALSRAPSLDSVPGRLPALDFGSRQHSGKLASSLLFSPRTPFDSEQESPVPFFRDSTDSNIFNSRSKTKLSWGATTVVDSSRPSTPHFDFTRISSIESEDGNREFASTGKASSFPVSPVSQYRIDSVNLTNSASVSFNFDRENATLPSFADLKVVTPMREKRDVSDDVLLEREMRNSANLTIDHSALISLVSPTFAPQVVPEKSVPELSTNIVSLDEKWKEMRLRRSNVLKCLKTALDENELLKREILDLRLLPNDMEVVKEDKATEICGDCLVSPFVVGNQPETMRVLAIPTQKPVLLPVKENVQFKTTVNLSLRDFLSSGVKSFKSASLIYLFLALLTFVWLISMRK